MPTFHKAPTKAKLQKLVDRFNEQFPIGTTVLLRKDTGEIVTKVRGPAEILSGHSAVAWFAGVSGCYSIEDVRVTRAKTIEFEYEAKPVKITVPFWFDFKVGDVLTIRKAGDAVTLRNPHGDTVALLFDPAT